MMEDQTTEHVKEEVVDCGYGEVPQDVHQLCTACLCATRTTHTLSDDALKQYYMHILSEMQLEGGVVLQSPRVCWECVSHLKRSVRFREQVQDSYRLLQPMLLSMCDKEDVAGCLQTSASRPERLKACFAFSIDIAPQDDDAQVMTVTTRDDDYDAQVMTVTTRDDDYDAQVMAVTTRDDDDAQVMTVTTRDDDDDDAQVMTVTTRDDDDDAQVMTVTTRDDDDDDDDDAGASECLDNNIERCFAVPEETVAAINEENIESFCDEDEIINKVTEELIESPLMNSQGRVNNEQSEEPGAHTRTEVMNDIKTINTPNSTHESTGDVNATFVCDYCYKRFTSKAALERHIATYNIYPHANKTVPSPCADCAVVLCSDDQCSECPNKLNLLQHNNMNTNMTKVLYQCKVCHKSFPLKGNLLRHTGTHTGEKPFQCEVCNKSFSQKDNLKCHLRQHTGERPFQCEVCHKSYPQKSSLVRHIKTHTGEKPFPCEVCHKSFLLKHHLRDHLRTHTGEKPYQCEVCDKSFTQKITLMEHLRTHTGEKPFQCKECHKSFSQKCNLAVHIKRHHTGDEPFQCKVCHKWFSIKSILAIHIKTHTDEKPQCKVCHKSFSLKSNLARHIKTHDTGEKTFQCVVCNKYFTKKSALAHHKRIHKG